MVFFYSRIATRRTKSVQVAQIPQFNLGSHSFLCQHHQQIYSLIWMWLHIRWVYDIFSYANHNAVLNRGNSLAYNCVSLNFSGGILMNTLGGWFWERGWDILPRRRHNSSPAARINIAKLYYKLWNAWRTRFVYIQRKKEGTIVTAWRTKGKQKHARNG